MKKTLLSIALGALMGFTVLAQNLVANGGFELPDDGIKHFFITERTAWLSDDMTSNNNGTEYSNSMEGNYQQYCVSTAGKIYQVIDKVSDKAATYKVSYLSGITWNADAGNDTLYSVVYLSHFSPGNLHSRTLIDSIATDITSEAWNSTITVSINIPEGVGYAGDSLAIEFATRVKNEDNPNAGGSWTNMDSVVVTKITTFELPVVNGGFELPDDGVKHFFITERTGWYSDDMTSNNNGTEYSTSMEGKYQQYCVSTAGKIYQPIDVITSDSAEYSVNYLSGITWNADAGNDTMYSVVYLSHYTPGSGIQSRTLIDSIATDITAEAWNSAISATLKVPASSGYEGDSLVLEFATRVKNLDNPNAGGSWTNMDSVVVWKTGVWVPTTQPIFWTTFPIAKVLDGANIPADHDASMSLRWDASNLYLNLSVQDDTILTNGGDIYAVDNVEIYIDINNGKLADQPRDNGAWPPAWQSVAGYYQERVVPGFPYDSSAMGNKIKGVTQVYTELADGYKYELVFPWDSIKIGFMPAIGDSIGFDIDLSINTGKPFYRNQITWNSPLTSLYRDPACWGTLELSEYGTLAKVPDVTAPSIPLNLVATETDNKVKLDWVASTDNIVVQNYIINQGSTAIDTILAKTTGNTYTTAVLNTGEYSFTIVAMDLYKNKSVKSAPAIVEVLTSTANHFAGLTNIYPNPSTGLVTINYSGNGEASLKVLDMTGKVVKSDVFTNTYTLDLTNNGAGLYIIRVNDEVTKLLVK